MTSIIIVVLVCIIIALIALVFILLKNKTKDTSLEDKKAYVNSLKSKKTILDKIKTLDLPKEIENLPNKQIIDISRKIYRIYESLDYKNITKDYYNNSWHTWQLSFFLCLYKKDLELFVSQKEKVFKNDILRLKEEELKLEVNKIIEKYKKEVNPTLGKDILSRNKIWSGEEVSVLMYFLSIYKNEKK